MPITKVQYDTLQIFQVSVTETSVLTSVAEDRPHFPLDRPLLDPSYFL